MCTLIKQTELYIYIYIYIYIYTHTHMFVPPHFGHFTPGNNFLRTVQEVEGVPGPSSSCGKSRPSLVYFLYSLLLCFYLVGTCFFVVIVLHFAFYLYLQQTTQTSMPPAGFEFAIPATDRSATGIGGIRFLVCAASSESLYRLSYPSAY
jgi:hypothetical protein